MFSSRLYPHFVRAVSFQTCDRTFEQLWLPLIFQNICWGISRSPFSEFNKSRVGRSEFPVQAPLEPDLAPEKMAGNFSFTYELLH
ncbi:hypothetical protein E8L90_27725 [Brevibacillus antibioticus]|uniref:Uncharacterized protein n=1 Tax=Brevibacillus antibioticus TaxID=2570228 RepID=A0A4U2YDD2_9BACL|nr:hypothetical protein E8L90_27725 [Brevibacillus antibioticus]